MYSRTDLINIGKRLIDIKTDRVSAPSIVTQFKTTYPWSKKVLANKTIAGKEFANICNQRHSIRFRKEPVAKEFANLPPMEQPRPTWAEIRISGEENILVVRCHKTHAAGKFIPSETWIEPIEVRTKDEA